MQGGTTPSLGGAMLHSREASWEPSLSGPHVQLPGARVLRRIGDSPSHSSPQQIGFYFDSGGGQREKVAGMGKIATGLAISSEFSSTAHINPSVVEHKSKKCYGDGKPRTSPRTRLPVAVFIG